MALRPALGEQGFPERHEAQLHHLGAAALSADVTGLAQSGAAGAGARLRGEV